MKKIAIFLLLLVSIARAQTNIVTAEYFIDSDPGFGNANPLSLAAQQDVQFQFPLLANQATGMHTIGIRSKDASGIWSHTNFFPVYVADSSNGLLTKIEYFWDTDPGFGNAMDTILTSQVVDLSNGMFFANVPIIGLSSHILFVRSIDTRGRWSHTNYADSVIVNGTVNVTELAEKSGINIYPNPFRDEITIAPEKPELIRIILYDESGRKLIDNFINQETKINSQSLSKGAYTLFVWTDKHIIYRTTVIKQ